MKVCIDCSPLLVRSAGVRTYLHHWLRALRSVSEESIVAFLEPKPDILDHTAGLSRNFARLAALGLMNLLGSAAVSRCVPQASVFHVSNLLRYPPRGPGISATLHDLTAWIVPEFHKSSQVSADQAFAETVLRPARGLICVSENTRRDAEKILGLDPKKMAVIYPGVPDVYFAVGQNDASAAASALGLALPYFLFVGTIEPRKNLDGLLSAWLGLPEEFRHSNQLVVGGMAGWKADATMRRLQDIASGKSGVRYLGYVAERWMPGLTAGAQALLFPSFYEGFGIPVAQALAAGCPVITSNLSSLPEVTGDAGLMVDPRSTAEIATAIKRIAESESLRSNLIAMGRERARLFRWDRAARQSLDYFRTLAG